MTRYSVLATAIMLLVHGEAALAQGQDAAQDQAQEAAEESQAQDKPQYRTLNQVTVTATKRETKLSDTPLPISVVSADDLDKMGAAGFEDYFASVPNLSMIDVGPGQKRYSLRGVQGPGEAQVGLYYDEIPVTGPRGESLDSGSQQPDIKLWDVDRVEVLRGPQGTLYGSGSMGGTIRIISKQPRFNRSEYAISGLLSSTKGGGLNYETRGMANIPLIDDKLALRVTGYHVDNDGFIDNPRLGTDKINGEETSGGRASLRWRIDDDSMLSAYAYVQNMETGGAYEFNRAITSSDSDLKSDRFIPQPFEDEARLYNLTYNRSFDSSDLVVSLSRYTRKTADTRDVTPSVDNEIAVGMGEAAECTVRTLQYCSADYIAEISDADGVVPIALGMNGGVESNSFEARLVSKADGAFRWTGGVFYQDRESLFRNAFEVRSAADPGATNALLFSRENTRYTKMQAVFAEAEYDVTQRLTAIGGLRWSKYDINEEQWTLWSDFPPFGPPITSPVFAGDMKSSESTLTPKLSLSYKLSDDARVYALYSEGFRAGGPNPPAANQEIPAFKSDSNKNYELGLKTVWLDGSAIVNVSLFRIDWKDILTKVYDTTGSFDFITNFGKAAISGFELETIYHLPGTGFTFNGQVSMTDSELVGAQPDIIMIDVGGVPTAVAVSDPGKEGDPLPNVPKWSAFLSVDYERQLGNGWDMYAFADWQFTGSAGTTFSKDSVNYARRHAYNVTNARFGLSKGGLELGFFVKNVFNDITDQGVNVVEGDVPFTITTRPRTVGVEATWRF